MASIDRASVDAALKEDVGEGEGRTEEECAAPGGWRRAAVRETSDSFMLVRSESVKVGLWVHTIHGLTAHGSVGVQSSMAAIAEPCDWPTLSPSLVYRPGVSLSSRTHSAGVVLFINAMGSPPNHPGCNGSKNQSSSQTSSTVHPGANHSKGPNKLRETLQGTKVIIYLSLAQR